MLESIFQIVFAGNDILHLYTPLQLLIHLLHLKAKAVLKSLVPALKKEKCYFLSVRHFRCSIGCQSLKGFLCFYSDIILCFTFHSTILSAYLLVIIVPTTTIPKEIPSDIPFRKSNRSDVCFGPKNRTTK